MKLCDALKAAERRLASAGIDTPRVDAELLLAHVAGTTRSGLYADLDREVDGSWEQLLERRAAREPLAYVLGEWGFRRLTLKTDPRALVPRPETEIVVERCLALLEGIQAPRVLDIGVGSGAIALALKDERVRAGQQRARYHLAAAAKLGEAFEQHVEIVREQRRGLKRVALFQPVQALGRLRAVGERAEAVDRVGRQDHRLARVERGDRVSHRLPSTTRSIPARSRVIATSW